MQNGQTDSAEKNAAASPASTITSDGSPVQTGRFYQHPARPRWHGDIPSRDSSLSSIQSFGSAATASPPASSFVYNPAKGHQGQPRRSTLYSAGSPPTLENKSGSGASASTNSSNTASPASPASLVGTFPPFAGTPPPDFSFMKDRFPFANADGHSATAIKG